MVILWAITGAWNPPFRYRVGDVPPRAVIASVDFSTIDVKETGRLQDEARKEVTVIYENDPTKLNEKLGELKGKVLKILEAKSFDDLDPQVKEEFFNRASPNDPAMIDDYREDMFQNFRLAMEKDPDAKEFEAGVRRALLDQITNGLLDELAHNQDEGTLLQVRVRPQGSQGLPRLIATEDVRIGEVRPEIEARLKEDLASPQIAEPVFYWLSTRLPTTLTRTEAARAATQRDRDEAAAKIPPKMIDFKKGETRLATGLTPLAGKTTEYDNLKLEYDARLSEMTTAGKLAHTLADFGMYLALYVLCGFYIFYHQPRLLSNWRRFVTLLALAVATIAFAWWMSIDQWRAELVPLLLFAMTAAIAYRQEVALLLSAAVCVAFTLSSGFGLAEFTTLLAPMAVAVLLLGRVRSRTKLLYVGLGAGVAAVTTALGVGTLAGQNIGTMPVGPIELPVLLVHSLWLGGFSVLAGLLMTGLLPFVESLFDVQTDISLLELGDAAHPLLQELVRRAPGTYNHSINVASISEAAADAIGANGLLCRVGAYFHDIGKMLKPGYFVENQSGGNRHDTLMPAMSTLVIIAHVKDGADLARQHGLPQAIIDFIQQHHGTTLVEYFYRQASQQREDNPDAAEVEESDFRYPGPKPQSREAGVMMLADAVESASRTLVDPTPSRIESLVEDIAMKRLLDGQFDESNLTLSQLRVIQNSLVKSMTAVYHGRVKYPDQQTA